MRAFGRRSGRDIDAEHGSNREDPEDVEPPGAIGEHQIQERLLVMTGTSPVMTTAGCGEFLKVGDAPDNFFLNCRTSAILSLRRSRRRSHQGKLVRRRRNLEQNEIFLFLLARL
jgi:hypothetical protein